MKFILDLFLALRDKNITLSIKSIIFEGLTIFGKDYPVEQILSEVFEYKLTNDYVDQQLLIEFCTLDTEKIKLKEDFYVEILNSVANIIFSHDYSLVLSIFRQLISVSLNKFGEIFIKDIDTLTLLILSNGLNTWVICNLGTENKELLY